MLSGCIQGLDGFKKNFGGCWVGVPNSTKMERCWVSAQASRIVCLARRLAALGYHRGSCAQVFNVSGSGPGFWLQILWGLGFRV